MDQTPSRINSSCSIYTTISLCIPMPYDPVRDALNSPISQTQPMLSPNVPPTPSTSSGANSYFNPSWSDNNVVIQSPTSARRATDLSVLLNAEDRVPSPTNQRRPSSSGTGGAGAGVGTGPNVNSGTPRPRSAHLSHILQPNSDEHSPPVAMSSPLTASPLVSPLAMHRDTNQPTLSKSVTATLPPSTSVSPTSHHSDPVHRPSSSGVSGPSTTTLSPKLSRSTLSGNSKKTISSPLLSHQSPTMDSAPKRSTIPYAPQQRRSAPTTVMIPSSDAEREFYKSLTKNPLRLGKRKIDEVSNDDLRLKPASKHSRDVGLVVEHCMSFSYHDKCCRFCIVTVPNR